MELGSCEYVLHAYPSVGSKKSIRARYDVDPPVRRDFVSDIEKGLFKSLSMA